MISEDYWLIIISLLFTTVDLLLLLTNYIITKKIKKTIGYTSNPLVYDDLSLLKKFLILTYMLLPITNITLMILIATEALISYHELKEYKKL